MFFYVITFKCAVSIYIEKGFGEMKHRFFRKTVQVVMSLTLLVLFCVPIRPAEAASAAEPYVLVGLAYGSGAAPGGNVVNEVGAGYRYGYLDEARNFVPLGYTSQTNVSVVKTENVYYGGPLSNGYKGYSFPGPTTRLRRQRQRRPRSQVGSRLGSTGPTRSAWALT